MQDLYATSFRVLGEEVATAYEDVGRMVARWAWRGPGAAPDVFAASTGSTPVINGYRLTWEEISVPDRAERALEVVLRHPDPQVEGREWRTVVDICRKEDCVAVTVRVAREAVELRLTPAPLTTLRRPGIVAQALNGKACAAGALDLTATPASIHVTGVDDFVNDFLRAEQRALPMVVLTPDSGRRSDPDANAVADELAGLAHVVQLGGHLAWKRFREAVGERQSVPIGGARIYWPGFGNDDDDLHHKYWTRNGLEALPAPFHRILFGLLTRISVHAVPLDRLPLELRRAASEARLKELRASGESSDELLELFAKENEELSERLADVESENDKLRSEIATHQQNYAAIAGSFEPGPDGDEADRELGADVGFAPQSWPEFVENLPLLEGPSFVVTPAAREMCNPSPYPDPARMWWHLEKLAEAAEAWAAQDCSVSQDLATWIHENYGIEVALHDTDLDESARFFFDGNEYSREPHVKVDDFKSPDECGRIYFAYVTKEPRFIVDHVGLHL